MRLSQLTQRDLKLIKVLCDYGLMTTEQIQNSVFKGIDLGTVLRRLRKLRDQSFIISTQTHNKGRLVWYAAPKGGKVTGQELDVTHLNRNTIDHDVIINDLRLSLEQAGATNKWTSGFSMKRKYRELWKEGSSRDVIPDGLFYCKSKKDYSLLVFCFEVELWLKSKRRYREILNCYFHKNGVNRIWYLVPNARIGETILKVWSDIISGSVAKERLVWSLIDELKLSPPNVTLHSLNGSYQLSDFIYFDSKIQNNHAHPAAQQVGISSKQTSSQKLSQTSETLKEVGSSENPPIGTATPDSMECKG